MRNLKKLLAVIVAICVLATFTVPAFAETKTDAKIAEELGVIQGTGSGVTAEYLASQPDRLQGAIMYLRLKGLEDDAIAFTGTANFADVAGLNDTNKAILAYLYANPELGFGGVGGGKFAATEKMEAKQYYKVLLTALGYTYGTDDTADFTWNNVMSFAASKGLVKLADVTKFTVNDLCVGTVEALKATVKGGTDILIAKLVLNGEIAADKAASTGLYVPSAVALQVASATADNLIVAKLVFNKELNKDTVTTANIKASALGGTGYTVTLGDDNKTVYAKLAAKANQDQAIDFTIENVKDTTGATITKVVRTINFRDTTIPSVSGVTVKNAKTLVIAASEPMMYHNTTPTPLASVKVDGNTQYGTATVDYVKNTITVELWTPMATGTRKIDVVDLTDYAGYKAVAQSYNVEVVEDKTAPVLVSAELISSTKIVATFDEIVKNAGTFTVDGQTAAGVVNADDKTKVDITFTQPLGIGATVEIKIGYKDTTDVMGNKVAATTYYTFKVTDDTSLPTVVSTTIAEGNKITLIFSKPMATASGTIKLLKASDSSEIATTGATFKTNDTVYEFTVSGAYDPMDVKVNIKNMTDASIRKNPLAEQNIPLRLLDTRLPVVQPFYTTAAGAKVDHSDDTITFYFNEPMNADTIKALGNYLRAQTTPLTAVSGASLKEVAANGMSVTFIVPNVHGTNVQYRVFAVKDVAGNYAVDSTTIGVLVGLKGATPYSFTTGSAIAIDKNTVTVEFSQSLGALDYTAFKVLLADGTTYRYAKSVSLKANTTTCASVELWDELPAGTSGAAVILAGSRIVDAYGQKLTADGSADTVIALTDNIRATATAATGTSSGSIKITFDEDMQTSGAAITIVDNVGAVVGSHVYFDKDGGAATPSNFRYVVVTGLVSGNSYTVVVNPSVGTIKDLSNFNANYVTTTATAK